MAERKNAENRTETAYAFWWNGSHKWRGWLALTVGTVLFVLGAAFSIAVSRDCGILHLAVQLAGTPKELDWLIDRCYANAATLPGFSEKQMFWADVALIAGYLTVFTLLIVAGWWRFETHLLRGCWWVIYLPIAAALVDLAEDVTLLIALSKSAERLTYGHPFVAQWVLITAAWTKWLLLFASLCALVMALAVLIVRFSHIFPPVREGEWRSTEGAEAVSGSTTDPSRRVDLRRTVDPQATPAERARLDPELADDDGTKPPKAPPPGTKGVVGVCLSGGGIRATAFALGVLQKLDDPSGGSPAEDRSALRSARYLSAVSGGSWAACAWTLQKLNQPETNAAETVITALERDAPAGYQRQKYLMNGRGGVLGPLWWVLLCSFVNLAGIASVVYLIAWPLGHFQTHCAVSENMLGPDRCGTDLAVPDESYLRFLAPSAVLAGAGLLLLIICGWGSRRWARAWLIGAVLMLLAVFTLFYLIALPWLFQNLARGTLTIATVGSAIGASGVIAVAGGVWRVLGGPVMRQVSERFGGLVPKLLGLVLIVGVLAWALVVMYFAAKESWSPLSLVPPTTYLLAALLFFSPNWPTLHDIFSHRLRRSFDPSAGQPFTEPPVGQQPARSTHGAAGKPVGETWEDLATKTRDGRNSNGIVPELILCCAQQRHGLAPGGLRADTFTISPHWVRQGYRTLPTRDYLDRAKTVKWRAKLNRIDVEHVSAWMATSGAAIASAMGRSSLGSTNALLAAINADLGVWLPNVRLIQSHPNYRFRRPTFGHFGKEIFGLYGSHDRYVFITDGGHWDNLGLVELLRRRCDEIYCIDASGDPPFTFAALRQSLTLASLELEDFQHIDVDFDDVLRDLKRQDDNLPRTNVVTFSIEQSTSMPVPTTGFPSDNPEMPETPPRSRTVTIHYLKLQASQDMGVNLRRYAIADPKFPTYSTAQQFLTPNQFTNLVEAGKEAGQQVAQRSS